MFFRNKLIGSLLVLSLLMVGCETLNSDGESPPELPPVESMQMNVSEMEKASSSKIKAGAESNFNTALFAAGVAKAVLQANLAIPKALLKAADNVEPQLRRTGNWEWNYSANAQGKSFEVLLTAEHDDNGNTVWKFYVSTDAVSPAIKNKMFFVGSTSGSSNSGSWVYFDLTTGEEVSEISWDLGGDTDIVKLEVKSDRNDYLGDTITYKFDGTIKTIVYLDASAGETTTISFNTETHAGYIISPNYNDGVKACWDGNLNNVSCS